ncbi:MAG: hypothetical protein IKF71_00090 [Bacilli bacterium]|nr:hypothetical protein [Bacilli bacterium]
MINTLVKTLQIDLDYSVNSFIYILSKLPILRDLITNDIYKSKTIKRVVGFLGIAFSIARAAFLKFMYFFAILFLCYKLFPNEIVKSFFHIYFLLTILGMFINNKLLNTSKKKYFAILIFNMDATSFFRANLFWNILTSVIMNMICINFFVDYLLLSPTILYSLILVLFTLGVRLVGEVLNIMFFRKYKYIWYTNNSLYFPILGVLIGCCFLPYLNIFIPFKGIIIFMVLFLLLGIPALIYLLNVKDYKLIYKRLSQITNVMDSKNEKDYLKQAMVDVKEKDKKIDSSIIEKKEGYDMFNTIFFERHKEILLRSARKYSVLIAIVYGLLVYLMINYENYNQNIAEFIHLKLAVFVIIMFFINRGSIITQAMFFNCDHAMLCFNFYRDPDVIVELFKKRLQTVVKVNLIPAFVIGIGNTILLLLSKNVYSIPTIVTTFLFIISLSIFFSVHYLVIYYLLQPFNKEMEVKRASYSFVTMGTYLISYWLSGLVLSSEILSILGVIFVIIYIVVALQLVYKVSPRTFRLK